MWAGRSGDAPGQGREMPMMPVVVSAPFPAVFVNRRDGAARPVKTARHIMWTMARNIMRSPDEVGPRPRSFTRRLGVDDDAGTEQ